MPSVQKRNNFWQYRVSYKDYTGQYKTKSKGGFTSKLEAYKEALEVEERLQNETSQNVELVPFVVYFSNWYKAYKKDKKSASNNRHYELAIKFCYTYFKDLPATKITRLMYQQAINDFALTHAKETVRKRHIYIKAFVNDLVDENILPKNFTNKIMISGSNPSKQESDKFLDFKEAHDLSNYLLYLKGKQVSHYFILVSLLTGLRYSETAGLTWDDLGKDSIKVTKSWDRLNQTFKPTKNKSSSRTIFIDVETRQIFLEVKWLQSIKLEPNDNPNDLIFNNLISPFPVSNNAVNKTLRKVCKKVGITKNLTCHGLRHTHGSLLLYKDVNIKYISRRLGHSDIGTTLQTYSHIVNELEQVSGDKITGAIYDLLDL